MPAPEKILQLVERFDTHLAAYKSSAYNETQTRRELIDPFFQVLGWDIDNSQGRPESEKDVIHEANVIVEDAETAQKMRTAPDYCFRFGGVRKFFVEAKKPSVSLKDNIHPAYQLRCYGWNAKLPVSILTDFEEFAVYDCRIMPEKSDKAAHARLWYATYRDYADKWDEFANLFSREAIAGGSLEQYAETHKDKRGALPVDVAFLQEIEQWRDRLARHLADRNPGLTRRDLNYAVQITIDRIIFLRICEGRGIEPYGRLHHLLQQADIYKLLVNRFREADAKYNSGIFHFKQESGQQDPPDTLTPTLRIDDDAVKGILKRLYYPDSPYLFEVIPAEILGQVYEQFLGKVICLDAAHQATVEEKPEVKKAGGVYYTPAYIVDYIVKQTVGELLKQKALTGFKNLSGLTLTILDPACGSGSFLLGAYQYLLDWHREQYLADDPKKWSKSKPPRLRQIGNDWKLTIAERKRILLSHIYGVDIDAQAVEVTKLSLLLKVLEGEDEQSVSGQMALLHERVLPNLSNNIKCGNSLIASDFYEGKQLGLMNEEELYRVNAFDWGREFPEIMKAGGFDALIGNPPYVRMERFKELKEYFRKIYESHDERTDLYVYFIEKSIQLLSSKGIYGVIVANRWIRSAYGQRLRDYLVKHSIFEHIIDFGELPVFRQAATMPAVIILRKDQPKNEYTFSYTPPISKDIFQSVSSSIIPLLQVETKNSLKIASSGLSSNGWKLGIDESHNIQKKLELRGISLYEYTQGLILYGIKTGLVEAFIIDDILQQTLINQNSKAMSIIKPYVIGDDVRKYLIRKNKRYIIYTYRGIDITDCENVLEYLKQFRSRLEKRATKQDWYELQQPQLKYENYYKMPKIIYPDIVKESRFAFDDSGLYPADTTFVIPIKDFYLLGILNSKLIFYYLGLVCPVLGDVKRGGRLRLKFNYMKQLPIPPINSIEKAQHDKMVDLVQQIMDLHKQLAAALNPQAQAMLQRQIAATNQQIDRLVYGLYGLTDEEIRIVEGHQP